jgi:hypothetical protein
VVDDMGVVKLKNAGDWEVSVERQDFRRGKLKDTVRSLKTNVEIWEEDKEFAIILKVLGRQFWFWFKKKDFAKVWKEMTKDG